MKKITKRASYDEKRKNGDGFFVQQMSAKADISHFAARNHSGAFEKIYFVHRGNWRNYGGTCQPKLHRICGVRKQKRLFLLRKFEKNRPNIQFWHKKKPPNFWAFGAAVNFFGNGQFCFWLDFARHFQVKKCDMRNSFITHSNQIVNRAFEK